MNYYYFNDKINNDSVNNLVDKLQTMEGKINLWFTTDGGNSDEMDFLISYLNSRKNDITVTLTGIIQSAGTHLLFEFLGDLIMGEGIDCFMFHCTDRLVYPVRDSHVIKDVELSKNDDELNKNSAKKIKNKGLLSKKQIKQFLKGKDIVVYKTEAKTWNIWK
jgi:ATP-dependent protease ClpP protease subunit